MNTTSLLGRRTGFAALALALATISGCRADSGLTDPGTAGQFSAVLTAGTQTSLHGPAGFLSLPATGPDSAATPSSAILILKDQKTSAQVGFQWVGTAMPATGDYSIGMGDLDVAAAFEDSTGAVFDGVGGTVTVATVSNGYVSGTFTVTAQKSDSTANSITIAGSFDAAVVVQ